MYASSKRNQWLGEKIRRAVSTPRIDREQCCEADAPTQPRGVGSKLEREMVIQWSEATGAEIFMRNLLTQIEDSPKIALAIQSIYPRPPFWVSCIGGLLEAGNAVWNEPIDGSIGAFVRAQDEGKIMLEAIS